MSHELSTVNTGSGAAIVCIGDAWHGLQNAFTGDAQKDLAQAGLNFEAVKLPIYALRPIAGWLISSELTVDGQSLRSDTFASLGIAADGYHVHQPSDIDGTIVDMFAGQEGGIVFYGFSQRRERYMGRCTLSAEHTVGGTRIIAMRLCQRRLTRHKRTRVQGTTVNVVCNNTLRAAWADNDCVVKRNHEAIFDRGQNHGRACEIAR